MSNKAYLEIRVTSIAGPGSVYSFSGAVDKELGEKLLKQSAEWFGDLVTEANRKPESAPPTNPTSK